MEDIKFSLENIDKTFVQFKVGAKVDGEVVASTGDGYIINIGGKKDAIVPFDDLKGEALEIGQQIEAVVIKTRDELTGAVILSKTKADDIKKGNEIIGNLKVGDETSLVIINAVNGGLISKIGTFSAFIPASQVSVHRIDLSTYVNKQVQVIILEIDLANNKVIASIRAYEDKEKQTAEQNFWSSIFEGKVVKGKVVRIVDFGVFVNVNGFDCLVHSSEISYDRSVNWREVLKDGEEYEFKVIKLEPENHKVSLSYKAMSENPLVSEYAKFKVDQVVEGTVKKILPFGAIIDLGNGVDGMLHIKEASAFYVKNIYEVAKVDQVLTLKVIEVDSDRLRISLSLKAMQMDELNKYMAPDETKKD